VLAVVVPSKRVLTHHMLPCHVLCCALQAGTSTRFPHNMLRGRMGVGRRSPGEQAEAASDYQSKLLHLAWHPEANVIACAASNSLYMYCA
jgi:serine/threonine-protein phosphatase 2A regulatory subunit B